MSQTCASCKHPQVREINHRIRDGRPIVDIERWLTELSEKGDGYKITRFALARHARDHVKVKPPIGRRPPSSNFLEAVRDAAHDGLEEGTLRVTLRDGISAAAELNKQAARSADRDLMAKIALALTGHSPLLNARVIDPEIEAIEAEFRPLLLTEGSPAAG
jgi:hypothetical protein